MSLKTEGTYLGDWLKGEVLAPDFCREKITVVSGQNLVSGHVVGKITASGKYAAYDNTAGDGRETAAGVVINAVDASAADAPGLILARGPAVLGKAGLTWHANNDAAAKAAGLADLATLHIIARDSA